MLNYNKWFEGLVFQTIYFSERKEYFMDAFAVGKQYYGFLLKESAVIEDIHSTGYLFEHIQSGAKLFYVSNKDDNKVFFISFKTPPSDDCGTPHILEHSVLCGSKKYQAKDPFNELAKGSLNTYLNALTYGDKTMYPVASRNEKDFSNMMDVYLDAVFFPRIYEKKEIFMQEGWHYVLEDEASDLSIKGVVYNEMKGALSDPESVLSNAISRSLFPTTAYGFESGGNPEAIPELTYENFLAFHKKYYHPSNSYIYLYGDMDIEKKLKWIDKEYLSKFNKSEKSIKISLEKDFSNPMKLEDTFSVSSEEDSKKNTFLSYNVRIGKSTDPALILSFDILNYILLQTNASPLKKALVDAGIADDTEGWFDSSSYDMVLSIIAKKSEKENAAVFQEVIEKTLQDIVKNGLDKKLIEATLNRWEFYLKEEYFGNRPKGLTYGMKLMKSWLHEKSPIEALRHWKHFETVKSALTTNYFEHLIEALLLNNTNKSIVVVSPEKGKQSKIEQAFKQKMIQMKQGLSESEIQKLIEENQMLEQYQQQLDSAEILNQIPFLKIEDIEKKADILKINEVQSKYNMIFTPLDTNGIVYAQLLFDTACVPQNLLPYAGLITSVFSKLDTKKYAFDTLPLEINFYTGGIHFSNDIYSESDKDAVSFVSVNAKVLEKNIPKLFELIQSILFETDFSQKENLKKIIKTAKINFESYMQNAPHLVGVVRSMSHIGLGSKIKEEVEGASYYHFLAEIEKNLEENIDDVVLKIQQTASYIFTKQNFFAAVSCEEKSLSAYQREIEYIYDKLSDTVFQKQVYSFSFSKTKEAMTSSSKIQYNIQSGFLKEYGYEYSGTLSVLKTILDLEYLWNTVRVQGGAYGCGSRFLRNGGIYFYSYRDPNIQKTYDIYQKAFSFLEEFCKTNTDLTKYILGTINTLDRPLSNGEKFDVAVARYFTNVKPEMLQRERDEILSTSVKELQKYVVLLEKATKSQNICTIGNEDMIRAQEDTFSSITSYL